MSHKKYKHIKEEEVYEMLISDVSLHDLADEHPLQTEAERISLKEALSIN